MSDYFNAISQVVDKTNTNPIDAIHRSIESPLSVEKLDEECVIRKLMGKCSRRSAKDLEDGHPRFRYMNEAVHQYGNSCPFKTKFLNIEIYNSSSPRQRSTKT